MNAFATLYQKRKRVELDGIEATAELLVELIDAALDDDMLAGPKRQKLGEIRGRAEDVVHKLPGVLAEANSKRPSAEMSEGSDPEHLRAVIEAREADDEPETTEET